MPVEFGGDERAEHDLLSVFVMICTICGFRPIKRSQANERPHSGPSHAGQRGAQVHGGRGTSEFHLGGMVREWLTINKKGSV
jgi:hypothetical protein